MFWGLIMEPQRRYTQTVKKAFHVSMAALDVSVKNTEPTQVICSFEGRNYLLCTLQMGTIFQVSLDLNFEVGDKVCFATNGKANVHLTGYLVEDYDEIPESDEGDSELNESDVSNRKRQSIENDTSPPKKKSKTLELLEAVNSQEEDDSDDSDVNLSDLVGEEEEDEDDTLDASALEEVDEDGEENEEEESESDSTEGDASSLSGEEDQEEEVAAKKPKVNGVSPKKQEKKQTEVAKTQVQLQKEKQQQKTPKNEKQQAKSDKTPKADKAKSPKDPAKSQSPPQKRTVEGGVVIEDIKMGNGPVAKAGRVVQVYYEGRFKNNNKVFDSESKGPGLKFRLGKQEVIKGWDVGVAGMKVGGKRRITCPPNMAYGQKGSPPTIPPNSTLVFEVELKNTF